MMVDWLMTSVDAQKIHRIAAGLESIKLRGEKILLFPALFLVKS